MLTIGTLARRTGTKVQTIRYYEQIGLMPEPGRSEGGQRRYAEEELDRLAFIRMGIEGENPFCEMARKEAEEKGWTFDEVKGSMKMLHQLIYGEWDDQFLVLDPGQTVQATHDHKIIKGV